MGSKGKKPILNDDDDSVDIDEMLKLVRMKHRRMFEEAAPPLVHRQGGVNGGGCDMSSSYMTRLCGGSLEDYAKDLNSAFSGMNMSGEKGIQKDLDDSFPLSDDQNAIREHLYLEKFVNSIVDEPNPNSLKPYHNISDSEFIEVEYRLNAPLSQHASDSQLQKIIRAQDHINDQAYLHTLRSSNAVALQQAALRRPGGNIDALVAPTIQSPQHRPSLLGKPPMLNQGYVGKSAYRPPLSSPVRNLENSHVSESPYRSLGPLISHAVKESYNSTGISNLGTVHVTLVLSELIRTNDNKISELTHIAGHYVELSKNHYGSRFIQQKLETAKKVEKDMVFREIKPHALTLMTDVFGNYVVQKFFDYGSKQQVRELVNRMAGCVYRFSLAIYSCRVIQKAIESIEVDLKIKLAGELEGHVLKCVQDKNGNHVIQKCIKHVPEHAIQFILSPILEQVRALCIHEHGCRVIQRVLESCHSQKTQRIALDEIMQSVTELVDDCYGNYILQHILQRGHPQVCSEIIKKLTGQMVSMSTLKYSSNVIEKCITYSSLEERKKIVDEILDFSGGIDAFQVMMTDPYGNYVVQRVLETCDELQLNQVLDRIRVHLNALRSHHYGKHILARLEQLVITGEMRCHILKHAQVVFGQHHT